MMQYKSYLARVEYDPDAEVFHGEVINTRDVITFQGRSVTELHKEMKASVDDYLDFCATRGEKPDKPFSGRFVLRVGPQLHRQMALAAAREGQSLNVWANQVIKHAI